MLGKTFTKDAVAALAGNGAEIEPLLTGLVRKEVLGVQADPRSPEHGQYGFLQDLVRHVAYETLSKRERRAKHLAAAEYLSRAFAADEDEVVEVIASHYLAADEAVPDSEDAADIRGKAQGMLVRAGLASRIARRCGGGEALLRAGGGADRCAARTCLSASPGRSHGRLRRRSRRSTNGPRGVDRDLRAAGRHARLGPRPSRARPDRCIHRPSRRGHGPR